MKPGFLLVLAVALSAEPISPGGGNRVEAIVEKTGLFSGKRHVLAWQQFSGTFAVMPARVELVVQAGSMKVLDDWLGAEKKEDVRKEALGKNILDASHFPEIRFQSTRVSGDTGDAFQVAGNLTIRGITRPVTLTIRRTGKRYEGETRFPMSSFGIKPPKAALGTIGTKDEMTIRFVVESSQ